MPWGRVLVAAGATHQQALQRASQVTVFEEVLGEEVEQIVGVEWRD